MRCAVAASVAMAAGAPVHVQAQTASNEYLGMKVTLSLNKTEIVAGEPIFLNIHVLNELAPYRKGNFGARLFLSEGNDINVTVQPPGELPYRYTGGEDPAVYSSVEIDLDNGEAMDHEALLLYDKTQPGGYLFGKPGVYIVRITLNATILRDPQPFKVEMPPTQIVVKAPEGREAEAFNLLNDPAMARALHLMQTSDAALVAKARQVAEQYPETPYAPLCRSLSGLAWYRAEPPQFDQAAAEYLKFLEFYPDHPRAAESAFTLVVIYTKAGRAQLAQDWFYFVKDAYPRYRLLRRENPIAWVNYFWALDEVQSRPWWLYQRPWEAPSTAKPAPAGGAAESR